MITLIASIYALNVLPPCPACGGLLVFLAIQLYIKQGVAVGILTPVVHPPYT